MLKAAKNNVKSAKAAIVPKDSVKRAIVVFGSTVHEDGSPSQSLENRLERTLIAAENQPNAVIIVSGGFAHGRTGENQNEAEAMKRWLVDHEVDERRIVLEDRAGNTLENAQFSTDILKRIQKERQFKFRVITVVTGTAQMRRGLDEFVDELRHEGLQAAVKAAPAADPGGEKKAQAARRKESLALKKDRASQELRQAKEKVGRVFKRIL
jgi:uncharacterized SAM-binding protein YcdF (DUF218 family)